MTTSAESDYVVDIRRTGRFRWTYQVNDAKRPDLWGIATIAYGKCRTEKSAREAADRCIKRDRQRRGWYNEGSTYLVKDKDGRG